MTTKMELSAIDSIQKQLNAFKDPPLTLTLEKVFEDAPEQGDYLFEDIDPGDPRPWYCDDCHRYHKSYVNWKFERKNGKRALYRFDGDEDGNWEIDLAWEDGEDPTEILNALQNETSEYFKAWVEYDLYCAETGKDGFKGESMSRAKAIKSAQENIKYLYMGVKNG